MQFHPDTRRILKSAIQLALARGAESVTLEHLLECDPDRPSSEPSGGRDLSFHPETLAVLTSAAEWTTPGPAIVRPIHLELALLIQTGSLACWKESQPFFVLLTTIQRQHRLLAPNLHAIFEELYDSQGFPAEDAQVVVAQLARFQQHSKNALGIRDLPVLILLHYAMSTGPIGDLLRRHGLDEATLAPLVGEPENHLEASVRITRTPNTAPDFTACLGPGYHRLSQDSRKTLGLAWILRDQHELTGRDLLRALLATSNQLEDNNIHSLLGELRPQISWADGLVNSALQDKAQPPSLSAEIYRVFDAALRQAGSENEVTPQDLLLGLAEGSQALGDLSAQEIRRHLRKGNGPF